MHEFDVTAENKIQIGEAARLMECSPHKVYRLIREGEAGVRLGHGRFGSRLYTSPIAITKFMAKLAAVREERVKAGEPV